MRPAYFARMRKVRSGPSPVWSPSSRERVRSLVLRMRRIMRGTWERRETSCWIRFWWEPKEVVMWDFSLAERGVVTLVCWEEEDGEGEPEVGEVEEEEELPVIIL